MKNKKQLIIFVTIFAFIALPVVQFTLWASASESIQPELGTVAGQLRDCSDSVTCAYTAASRPHQRVPALTIQEPAEGALARMKTLVEARPKVKVIQSTKDYLHAEFRDGLMGAVEDLEVLAVEGAGELQVRSSSRVGIIDLGSNRKRVNDLTSAFQNGSQKL